MPHFTASAAHIHYDQTGHGPDIVWVGGGGTIQHFDGKTLVNQVSGTTRTLLAVWSNRPNDVWAVGEQATILHGDGKKWSVVPAGIAASRPARELSGGGKLTPGNDLLGVWSSGTTTWIVGGPEFPSEGFILRSSGSGFTPAVAAVGSRLLCIWGSGPSDIWTAGEKGLLMHFDGTTWHSVNVGSPATLTAGWASDANHVWLAGESGTLMRYEVRSGGSHRSYERWERRGMG